MAVKTSIIIIDVINYLSEKKKNICFFSHGIITCNVYQGSQNKNANVTKKSHNSVWVNVCGKSDQGIEVPYGPIT